MKSYLHTIHNDISMKRIKFFTEDIDKNEKGRI